ncbi:ribosome assembly RNA-binding protein YhbY [Salinicoccus halodurans]|uniref:RNA-binding protein n=1 Tax=Salinicoccus halodurans TaxID=407035 RepID=A0A0F7HJQ6_9STAP|nr:ribosome assembly RNA-binding protein YhbY [Salinicoccus halodurans]AKG73939.1 RNA-binding protein [Salinicoccus halodurans]SFK58166.1 RNA-binding protein [Salinicoccus halodurans]
MNNLTSRQVKQLKSKAHHLNPIFQVGKNGVNDNFTEQISDVLEKRELIKISILQNCLEDKDDIAKQISDATESHVVTIIGNTIILYKESENSRKIELS